MYHCHIYFYLTGCSCNAFEIMKKTHPFDRFTHDFLESGRPKEDLAAKADVIFFHLKEAQAGEALQA